MRFDDLLAFSAVTVDGLPHPGGGFESPTDEALELLAPALVLLPVIGFPHPGGGFNTPTDAFGLPLPGGGLVAPEEILTVLIEVPGGSLEDGLPHPSGGFVTPTETVVATLPGTATNDLVGSVNFCEVGAVFVVFSPE